MFQVCVALPGKLWNVLRPKTLLFNEVDKIGQGINWDPAIALVGMLNPEQNNSSLDHQYVFLLSLLLSNVLKWFSQSMDVPVDLSQLLFVCTGKLYSFFDVSIFLWLKFFLKKTELNPPYSSIISKFRLCFRGNIGSAEADCQTRIKCSWWTHCKESGVWNILRRRV